MVTPEVNPRSPLQALSIERFGGGTILVETVVVIDVSLTRLLPNNPNRLFWSATNATAYDVRLSTDPGITVSTGWLLAANGGVIESFWEEDGEGVGYDVYAIANGHSAEIRVREVIRL